jgi:ribonuclease H2 subunit C
VVLLKTNRVLPRENQDRYAGQEDAADIEEDEEEQETGILEEKATFNNVMVWGHEMLVDKEDVYVRALEEWVGVAESVSCVLILF